MRPPALVCLALGVAATLATTGAVHAEVSQKSDIGFVTGAELDVPDRSPLQLWQTLIVPAGWWNPLHSWSGDAANLFIDPQAGGCFCELLPKPKGEPDDIRRGSVEHMRVIAAMPPKLLRLSRALGPLQGEALTGTLTVTFKPIPAGGTHLAWSYVVSGYMRMKMDEIAPLVDKVLAEQFTRLAQAPVPAPAPLPAASPPADPGHH